TITLDDEAPLARRLAERDGALLEIALHPQLPAAVRLGGGDDVGDELRVAHGVARLAVQQEEDPAAREREEHEPDLERDRQGASGRRDGLGHREEMVGPSAVSDNGAAVGRERTRRRLNDTKN